MVTVEHRNLPPKVKEVAQGAGEREICSHCGSYIFYITHESEGEVYVYSSGRIPGDGAGWGGRCIEDPGALPRQLVESNGIYICGSCLDTDTFESAGRAIYGVANGTFYAALGLGTVIDDHYVTSRSFDGSLFEPAFESIVSEDTNHKLADGTVMTMVTVGRHAEAEKDSVTRMIRNGESPFEFPVMAGRYALYVPQDKVDETVEYIEESAN